MPALPTPPDRPCHAFHRPHLRHEIQQQIREVETKFMTELDRRGSRFGARFDKIDERFNHTEERFEEIAAMKRYEVSTGIAIIAMGSRLRVGVFS